MRTLTPLVYQHGLALVETAITLPFLFFVMLAATEFTNAFVEHTTLTKAVRDGARYAAEEAIDGSLTVNVTAALKNETRNLVVFGNTTGTGTPAIDGLTVNDVTVSNVGSNNIEVSVTYAYTGILGTVLPGFGYGSDISLLFNLGATVTMRAL
jgi:Flp pilus assembly protein TadG